MAEWNIIERTATNIDNIVVQIEIIILGLLFIIFSLIGFIFINHKKHQQLLTRFNKKFDMLRNEP